MRGRIQARRVSLTARVLVELNVVYEATSEARHILKDS